MLHNSQDICECDLSNQHENMSLDIWWKINAIIEQLVPRAIPGSKMVGRQTAPPEAVYTEVESS